MTSLLRRARESRAILYLGALSVVACSKPQNRPQRPAVAVAVTSARRAPVPYTLEANGIVTPIQSASVASQVDGIITNVFFQEGQEVERGQPLFQVDQRPYRNAYEQALATFSRDSATAANAQKEVARYAKLVEQRYVTKEEGDQLEATSAASEAVVRSDRAAVATARFNLENTTIRAPISGKTGSLLVRVGNLVHANGATALVTINQVRPIMVRFAVPSSQLPLILQYGAHGGLPVTAIPGGAAVSASIVDSSTSGPVDAPQQLTPAGGAVHQSGHSTNDPPPAAGGGQSPALGTLSFIDNAVDTTTGTVTLKATFANTDGSLWAGQFASTTLRLFVEQNALVVPTQAVVTGQRGTYVYVIDGDTAKQRPVSIERAIGGISVVASGLTDGARVVTDGQSRLTPGAKVLIRSPNDSAGGGAAAGQVGGRGGGRRRAKG
ncbi:MAG TPA: efflux RND transporter periplasmic adaptor subunit [Gemmatimonadaceae bacterium]|nr:efflux RND transporter periplasmic adaptor subunit [Gemmatimonadaceae bacterium]